MSRGRARTPDPGVADDAAGAEQVQQPPLPGFDVDEAAGAPAGAEDGDRDPFFDSLGPRFAAFVDGLRRPVVFFDTETTGTDPQRDRIVEISLVRVLPGVHRLDGPYTFRVNPQIPIPEGASRVHGIYDADVADCPPFEAIAPKVRALFEGADIAGFNVLRFDLRLLEAEFARAKIPIDLRSSRIIDAQVIFHQREPRTLSAAMRFYRGKELEGAHGAQADTLATVEVLAGQLARYDDLPADPDALHEISTQHERAYVDSGRKFVWQGDEAAFNFGKLKGMPLREVAENPEHKGYLRWMLAGSFDPDTKRIVQDALEGRFPKRSRGGRSEGTEGAADPGTGR